MKGKTVLLYIGQETTDPLTSEFNWVGCKPTVQDKVYWIKEGYKYTAHENLYTIILSKFQYVLFESLEINKR